MAFGEDGEQEKEAKGEGMRNHDAYSSHPDGDWEDGSGVMEAD